MKIELSDKEIEFIIRALVKNYAHEASDYDPKNIADTGIPSLVIGKLLAQTNKYEVWKSANDSRYIQNKLNQALFCGAGYHSGLFINDLHKRLNFAVSELSGMQQNGGMGSEFDEESDKRAKQNIKDVLDDMKIAFGIDKWNQNGSE